MAVVLTVTIDINGYVEAKTAYNSGKVRVDADGSTFVVKAYPADIYGVRISGASDICTRTLADFTAATVYYNSLVQQLNQGDVIRNP